MPLAHLFIAGALLAQPQPGDPAADLLAPPVETPDARAPELLNFEVRRGYQVTLGVAFIPGARFMCFDDDGALYVSRPSYSDVLRLTDEDDDGEYESRTVFATGLPTVQAIQFEGGALWMAATGSIHRATDADGDGVADEVADVLEVGTLPREGVNHERALLVKGEQFYTVIGDGSNISDQSSTERQAIWRYNADASRKARYAGGIRNCVELRFRPGSSEIWGFDEAPTGIGWSYGEQPGSGAQSQPIGSVQAPDELNWYRPQRTYGHPHVIGARVPHPEYADDENIGQKLATSEPPEFLLPAHSCPGGFDFLPAELAGEGKGMPADHAGDAFVALRGRSPLPGFPMETFEAGYSVARVLFDGDEPYGMLELVRTRDAQSDGGRMWARPVDVVTAPDGSLLFSSELPTGRIYRIRWVGNE